MHAMRHSFFLLILLACVPFLACSSKVYLPEGAVVQDGKYDMAFPQIEAAAQFEDILSSIRMINSVAYYKHLLFARQSGLTQADLNNEKIEEKATNIEYFQDTASGTATVIHFQGDASQEDQQKKRVARGVHGSMR